MAFFPTTTAPTPSVSDRAGTLGKIIVADTQAKSLPQASTESLPSISIPPTKSKKRPQPEPTILITNNSNTTRAKNGKDPNAPKKPLSSFLLFCQEHRGRVKAENANLMPSDINKLLGSLWEQTKDRRRWEEEAQRLNEQYKVVKEEYLRGKEESEITIAEPVKIQAESRAIEDTAKTSEEPKPEKKEKKEKKAKKSSDSRAAETAALQIVELPSPIAKLPDSQEDVFASSGNVVDNSGNNQTTIASKENRPTTQDTTIETVKVKKSKKPKSPKTATFQPTV